MSPKPSCVLGDKPARDYRKDANSEVYYLECEICGTYKSASFNDETAFNRMTSDQKAMISAYTRELHEHEAPTPELDTLDNEGQIEKIIERYKKKTVLEKFNNLVLYVGRKSKYFGISLFLNGEKDYPITYSENRIEFENIKNQAFAAKYFTLPTSGGNIILTWEGWQRFEGMKDAVALSKKCFVAMSCSEEMREIYENGIRRAVEEAGYEPIFIEREEHNEKICDLIIAEIRVSKFIIADVTGQRQNVYYEAGFAQGLNRDVIWTCKQNEIGQVHFDTRQYNHISWENSENLRKKLLNRIRATII